MPKFLRVKDIYNKISNLDIADIISIDEYERGGSKIYLSYREHPIVTMESPDDLIKRIAELETED